MFTIGIVPIFANDVNVSIIRCPYLFINHCFFDHPVNYDWNLRTMNSKWSFMSTVPRGKAFIMPRT